jgi:hypothetical protein
MTDIIPQIQAALLALYDTTEKQVATLNKSQLDDLAHLADESRNDLRWSARTAAEIVRTAVQSRNE